MTANETTNNGQNSANLGGQNTPQGGSNQGQKMIKVEGRVIEALPNAFFKVVLADGAEVTGFLSGKMRLNRIKILPGDRVTMEMTPYDMTKGRIVYRLK
jgi:translation initiation factor IF-1